MITIIDFSKPSVQERFFVIDLESKQVLYKSLVAHGKNSGENLAESFSNDSRSLKSCLGFFITAETYVGKHGYSLRLDGLEPGINDNARTRTIVIHGADYVSTDFANQYGRLGRSWGCPALPINNSKEIIDKISKGSCIFVYGNDPEYLKVSKILTDK
ncbi:MAG: murein L,D-transpeptidase catalytic domain family protein [Bacteroidia bacterium]|nr:murein L,D-transpeptidase catalytic domain family protein [Bacteroidia bacterium]